MYSLISIETGIDKHICFPDMIDQWVELRPNEHYLVCISFGSKLIWEIIELIKHAKNHTSKCMAATLSVERGMQFLV